MIEQAEEGQDGWWKGSETVSIFRHPGTGHVVVSVLADNGGTCGEFSASAWQIWTLEGGKLVEVKFGSAPLQIIGAVDIDGDGKLELLVKGDHFGTEAAVIDVKTLTPQVILQFSYNDCSC